MVQRLCFRRRLSYNTRSNARRMYVLLSTLLTALHTHPLILLSAYLHISLILDFLEHWFIYTFVFLFLLLAFTII